MVLTLQLDEDISGMKVGVLQEGFANCEEDVAALVRSACQHLVSRGVTLEEVSIPQHKQSESMKSNMHGSEL